MPTDPPTGLDADRAALDARLRAAARAGDAGALASTYRHAAELARGPDEAGFLRTHAYVWALVAGDRELAATLAAALRRDGRLD